MKRLVPTFTEVSILGTVALLCATIVASLENHAAGLFLLTFPVAVAASLMGARRSGFLSADRGPQTSILPVEQAAE